MEIVKSSNIQKIIKYFSIIFLGSIALTISAKIKIPFYPVPMTMQTLIVLFLGVIFGWRIGLAAVALYIFEGIIGLPVFAGTPEKGIGLSYFIGPTMGYLIGFLPAVFFSGFLKISRDTNIFKRFVFNFLIFLFSLTFIYIFGIIWLINFVPTEKIWALGVLPFLPAEILKISILTILVSFVGKSFLSWRSFR